MIPTFSLIMNGKMRRVCGCIALSEDMWMDTFDDDICSEHDYIQTKLWVMKGGEL